MRSGFEIPGIQHQLHQQAAENTCAPVMLSMNQTHIFDQIHTLSAGQQLFLDHHHFLPPHHQQSRPSHHYLSGGGAGSATPYFPVNFKLGLNEICTRNDYKEGTVGDAINEGVDALLRGSERYEIPEARLASIGVHHCWQNQDESTIKQPPFWEPLPAEVSNENSEIIDRQEHLEMSRKEAPRNCLDSTRRVQFNELEAIYKRLATAENNQTGPSEIQPMTNAQLPLGFDYRPEASVGAEASESFKNDRKKRKKKKKKKEGGYDQVISPMKEFFGNLVKQVMDHQGNLHKKFTEMIERLDEERRAREEVWRNQELAHLEQQAAARAREKALAERREAMIVYYLEKITGQRIHLPTFNPTEINSNDTVDVSRGHDGHRESPKLTPRGLD